MLHMRTIAVERAALTHFAETVDIIDDKIANRIFSVQIPIRLLLQLSSQLSIWVDYFPIQKHILLF